MSVAYALEVNSQHISIIVMRMFTVSEENSALAFIPSHLFHF